jgi:heme-degrading monooxygenase HmoA
MYTATFIFKKKQYDDAFFRLDARIAQIAKQIPGYLGEESFENVDAGRICNIYYWETLEALQQLMSHPSHQEAKAAQADWLDGYQVIISQVLRQYGDGRLQHPTAGV